MNLSALSGIGLTVITLAVAIMLSGPLIAFIDFTCLILVVGALPFALMCTHSSTDLTRYGLGGLRAYLSSSSGEQWGPAARLKAARIANSAGTQAMLIGAAGTYIGCVQMLQAMEDPSNIGPALAVASLTTLYGLLISALVCIPMQRHHELAALSAGASPMDLDQDHPLRNILMVLALLGLSVALSFLLILLAMT